MAIQKDIVINRKQYQDIKKMDHNQMNLYIQSIYKSGYAEGIKSVPGMNIAEIKKALLSVKGIGEKKAKDIVIVLGKEFENEI